MTINAQGGSFWWALQYTKYDDNYPAGQPGMASVKFLAQPNDADTLTIGTILYQFKTTPAAANDVLIGTALEDTLRNVINAITGVGSTGFYAGTKASAVVDATLGTNTLFLKTTIPGVASVTLSQSAGSSARYTITAFSGMLKGGKAVRSVGKIALHTNPAADEQLVVGATTYTYKATATLVTHIAIGATRQDTAANIGLKLLTNAAVKDNSVEVIGSTVCFTAEPAGAAGNSSALTTTSAASVAMLSGATLLGGQDATAFSKSTLSWKRHKARSIDYEPIQMQTVFPLEVGSTMVPTGAYKSGVALSGGVDILPRFEDDFGTILLAALGSASTSSSGGVGTHTFTFKTNQGEMPFLAVRKGIPGRDSIEGLGITGYDNKVALMRLTLPPAAPVEARLDFMGRVPELDAHPEAWEGDAYEDFKSAPITCKASFKLPTLYENQLPTTGVIVELMNGLTTPRQEMIVGSYFMDDIIALTRALMLRFTFKWNNPDLYRRAFAASKTNKDWSPTPLTTTTDGSDYAFDLYMEAPYQIPGTTEYYSLRIRANNVVWEPQGPPSIAAGGIVQQQYTATVLEASSGAYCEFILKNGNTTGYTLPSEP